MSIERSERVEAQLRSLAARDGRDIEAIVEEALRQYLEGLSITDVNPGDAASAEVILLAELRDLPDWKAEDA